MNRHAVRIFVVVALTLPLGVLASASVATKEIVVDFPSDLPAAAQQRSEAMFLYERDEQPILYLEQDQGRTLTLLDVTDPGRIRTVGQVSINAPAPFDFVQYLGHSSVLIHYRNHSGFAVLSLKDYKQPVLRAEPKYLHDASAQSNGPNDLLLVSSATSGAEALPGSKYEVVSISNPTKPQPLATIQAVIQRADRPETGTIFLLTAQGLNVVRCVTTERNYVSEMYDWYN